MKKKANASKRRKWRGDIIAADVFCGVGGLTRGLERAGIEVKVGVDIDPACEYPYTANNNAEFLLKSVVRTSASDLRLRRKPRTRRLLAGCAPCQPFSSYHQQADTSDRRWYLLKHFERLAKESDPDVITMENVPNLARQLVFKRFVQKIKELGYYVSHEVVDCSDFGVPQTRRRLVFLASKLGPIALQRSKRKQLPRTVKQAIGRLPSIAANEADTGVKSDADQWRAAETKKKTKANLSYDIRKSDKDIDYLGMDALAVTVEGKKANAGEQSLTLDAIEYAPVRNVVGHTGLLTDNGKGLLRLKYENIKARIKTLVAAKLPAKKKGDGKKSTRRK